MNKPILYIVTPCYNEEKVLKITGKLFSDKLKALIDNNVVSDESRVLFVDDGSKDNTWEAIKEYAKENKHMTGIKQSRNRGHQSSVLAGLMDAKDKCDITISIDCDGQDDINAIDDMISEYMNGADIVYGVRKERKKDTYFKRLSAELFYKLLKLFGAEVVFNHADYRLLSSRVLKELENYKEVNLYLRGLIPLVGFKSTSVYYNRIERKAGKSHYPLKKMLSLALNGITSLSIKPIRIITCMGVFVALISFIFIIWAIISHMSGNTVSGWSSIVAIISFIGGIQLISLGVIGEYIGKIYMETKQRPRYIISERTDD